MYLLVNDETGAVDVTGSVRGLFAALARGYHKEKPTFVNVTTEHGYTTVRINGHVIAHIDKSVNGRYLTVWEVPSVDRVEYTCTKEDAVKTIMGAFGIFE